MAHGRAPGDETPKRPITVASVLLIRKFCVVSVRKKLRVYGENACQALFQSRPKRLFAPGFIQSVTPRFKEALRWMAANRKAYHVVDEAELDKSVRQRNITAAFAS